MPDPQPTKPINLFYSYSNKDEQLREKFVSTGEAVVSTGSAGRSAKASLSPRFATVTTSTASMENTFIPTS
jgi:hypothetical protein